jgi:hypothetical protein
MTPVDLDVGILEVKGMSHGRWEALKPINAGLTKSAFSKYAVAVESLLQPLGRRV